MQIMRTADQLGGVEMRDLKEIMDNPKVTVLRSAEDGGMGYANIAHSLANAPTVVWSNGGGWDHVSVSFPGRCPTWNEMCKIKDIFFMEDECCVEYHPAGKDYVNIHPYCLHIWRPQAAEIPMPPKIFV